MPVTVCQNINELTDRLTEK